MLEAINVLDILSETKLYFAKWQGECYKCIATPESLFVSSCYKGSLLGFDIISGHLNT